MQSIRTKMEISVPVSEGRARLFRLNQERAAAPLAK